MDLPYIIAASTTTHLNQATLSASAGTIAQNGAVAFNVLGDSAANRLLVRNTTKNAPSTVARSTGTRVVYGLRPGAGQLDYAMGVSGDDTLWTTSPGGISWYVNNDASNPALRLKTDGTLEIFGGTLETNYISTGTIQVALALDLSNVGSLIASGPLLHLDVPDGIQFGTAGFFDDATTRFTAAQYVATTDVQTPRVRSTYSGSETAPQTNMVTPGTRFTIKSTSGPSAADMAIGANGTDLWQSIPSLADRWDVYAGATSVLSVEGGITTVRDRTLDTLRPIDIGPYDVPYRTLSVPGSTTSTALGLGPVPYTDTSVNQWTLTLRLRGTHHRQWTGTIRFDGTKRPDGTWRITTPDGRQGNLHGLLDRFNVTVNGANTDLDLALPLLKASGTTDVTVSGFMVFS